MAEGGLLDPLQYLPRTPTQEIPKGHTFYDPQHPTHSLYMVVVGRVKIVNTAEDSSQSVAQFVTAEELFGKFVPIPGGPQNQTATALEKTTVMSWTGAEIEQRIESEPRLGIALMQYIVRNGIELQDRIESMAIYNTPERVMLALLQLSEQLGTSIADGSTRISWLTHLTIAEYVGTSREIVSLELNRLRRLGFVRYSRKHMDVYRDALQETLRIKGVTIPHDRRTLCAIG